jgi:hypothetical protein
VQGEQSMLNKNKLLFLNRRIINFYIFCLGLFFLLAACANENNQNIQLPPKTAALGKIDGVFTYATPSQYQGRDWHLLRFYQDGLVLDTVVVIKTGSIAESWPSINRWFNREKIKLQNKYYILDDKIWFRIQGRTGNQDYVPIIDWWGTFTDQKITLDFYSHKTKSKQTDIEFVRLTIN